jgi:hypothetical protein
MKKIMYLLCLLFLTSELFAGQYHAGLGLRLEAGKDGNEGVTYKQFMHENVALEGFLLSDFNEGIEGTGLAMFQKGFPGAPKELMWYAGGGGHIGFWGDDDPFVAGVDGILGVEYAFKEIPLALSLDWHPAFNFVTEKNDYFLPMKFGVVARYIF